MTEAPENTVAGLTRALTDASEGVETWNTERKRRLCRAIKHVVAEIWLKYAKGTTNLRKSQLKQFLTDFSGLELTREMFRTIYRQIDYDQTETIDEFKMAIFIIQVGGLGGIVGKQDMGEIMLEEESPKREFILFPGRFPFE